MAQSIRFSVPVVHRKLAPGVIVSEALLSPHLSRLSSDAETANDTFRRALASHYVTIPAEMLVQECRSTEAETVKFELTIEPPRKNEAWEKPVKLSLAAAVRKQSGLVIARVPMLDITVVVPEKEELELVLNAECLAALRRCNATASLKALKEYARHEGFRIDTVDVTASLKTLKERSRPLQEEKAKILSTAATRLNWRGLEPAFELDSVVEQIADALTSRPPQSVLLVGPGGVGKTAAVRELVRTRGRYQLQDTPFFQTSGSRLVAGQCGFGMWEARCQSLVKEASHERAVVCFGSLVELMEVGKSEFNSSGLAAFLRPAIARGELIAVAECTPAQLTMIEKDVPQLLEAFRVITLEEPDVKTGRTILRKFAASVIRRSLSEAALDAIDRLHRRYATDSAFPGRPLHFLDSLLRDEDRTDAITADEVYSAFTAQTGLPRGIIDPAEPLDFPQMREWFAKRVIGQQEAVDLVTDLLATVKTGLTRPGRPIASLLFIGPTGVGKTETAKALAEYLFGSPDRLARFDMSEYADAVSIRRLIGGAEGGEGLLTAKVREQPFSVVLLDEVEKAHESLFDLLLQVLGEARLTDAGGRLAGFRNTVIVMTSNLGAGSYRHGGTGFGIGTQAAPDSKAHFTKAVESFLRPEMVNRLDRIVPFATLGEEEIRMIAEREWSKVLTRDGLRDRPLTLAADEQLTARIAKAGYDPLYGARPLQRAMERQLLAPLAEKLNIHAGAMPLTLSIGETVSVKPVQGARPRRAAAETSGGRLAEAARDNRRWMQLLDRSTVVRELSNSITQHRIQERLILKKQAMGQPLHKDLQQILGELGRARELQKAIDQLRRDAEELETVTVEAYYLGGDVADPALDARLTQATRAWDQIMLTLYSRLNPGSSVVSLAFFSEYPDLLIEYVAAYRNLAESLGMQVRVCIYKVPESQPVFDQVMIHTASQLKLVSQAVWAQDHMIVRRFGQFVVYFDREWRLVNRSGMVGAGLKISGPGAHLHFSGEGGHHGFPKTGEGAKPVVWVDVPAETLEEYTPQRSLSRKDGLPEGGVRRRFAQNSVSDQEFDAPLANLPDSLSEKLAAVIKEAARKRLVRTVLE